MTNLKHEGFWSKFVVFFKKSDNMDFKILKQTDLQSENQIWIKL